MDIVLVDPGYGRFLNPVNNSGNKYGELEPVENATYNPYSGVAFHSKSSPILLLPEVFDFTFEPTETIYKKVWSVKFSVYMDANASGLSAGFSHALNADVDIGMSLGNASSHKPKFVRFIDGNDEDTQINTDIPTTAAFYNVSVTYAVTYENGINYSASTIIFNDEVDYQQSEGAVFIPTFFMFKHSTSAYNHFHISNVLAAQATYDGTGDMPSDDGIPADTPIYRLPLGNPVTDFEQGEDGEYIAKENGKTLLQAANTDTLVTQFGDRPINHIVAYGNPGYRVGSNVSVATAISKSNDTVITHGSTGLDYDKTMHIYDVWGIGEGNTLSSINGLQVGWRSGW